MTLHASLAGIEREAVALQKVIRAAGGDGECAATDVADAAQGTSPFTSVLQWATRSHALLKGGDHIRHYGLLSAASYNISKI